MEAELLFMMFSLKVMRAKKVQAEAKIVKTITLVYVRLYQHGQGLVMIWAHPLLILLLACLSLIFCHPQALAENMAIPRGLKPGLYYYFKPGESKPSIYYVPHPDPSYGDPFSRPVKPLPIAGQENLPSLSYQSLQRYTKDMLQPYQEHARSPQSMQPPVSIEQTPIEFESNPQANQVFLDTLERQEPMPGNRKQQPITSRPYQTTNVNSSQPYGAGQTSVKQEQMAPPALSQSPFQLLPANSPRVNGRESLRGVSLEEMEKATTLARQAQKLIEQNRPKEASTLLERAALLDPNPNSGPIHTNLGLVQKKLGNLERAVTEYYTALNFEPHMQEAILGIASTYQVMGKLPESVAWYQKYLNVYPFAPDANDVRSMIAALKRTAMDKVADDPKGLDYFDTVISKGEFRWAIEKLPIKVFISSGSGVSNFHKQFRRMLIAAFDAWMQATENKLSWIEVNNPLQADIICNWASSTEGLEEATGAEGGQTGIDARVYADGTRTIEHCTITVLTLDLEGKPVTDDLVRMTSLHEVGHALGLRGHSSNNHDIMFFSESPTTSPKLTERDINTIARLYSSYACAHR